MATSASTPAIAYEYVWFAGQPVAQIESGTNTRHYYFNDHLGTPILTTNAAAAVDWRVEREPFGSRYTTRTARYQPLAFPGQEEDTTSDRSYNIFRWYRAGWGRYTQSDPIGMQGGTNFFSYVLDNPVHFADPRGLVTLSRTQLPDRIMPRDQLRNTLFPSGSGGQNVKGAFMAGRRVSCHCEGNIGCVRMSPVHIDVVYQYWLSTDYGNDAWPEVWRIRIQESIHEGELMQSTEELMALARVHEAQRYFTKAGCEFDCWRLRNFSRFTRWLPGLEETVPGFNPHSPE